jgi:hypothetical protein
MPRAAATQQPKTSPPKAAPPLPPNPEIHYHVNVNAITWAIRIGVDWLNLPMLEAQAAFHTLQTEYQRAAKLLNERAMDRSEHFHCFMAGTEGACKLGTLYSSRPMFIDNAYKAPPGGHKNLLTGQITPEGLYVQVRICSERCHALYQAKLIQERRDRELGK